jgi:hypothetical protein
MTDHRPQSRLSSFEKSTYDSWGEDWMEVGLSPHYTYNFALLDNSYKLTISNCFQNKSLRGGGGLVKKLRVAKQCERSDEGSDEKCRQVQRQRGVVGKV